MPRVKPEVAAMKGSLRERQLSALRALTLDPKEGINTSDEVIAQILGQLPSDTAEACRVLFGILTNTVPSQTDGKVFQSAIEATIDSSLGEARRHEDTDLPTLLVQNLQNVIARYSK